MPLNGKTNIVKKDGKCWNRQLHRWCFYWNAKISTDDTKARSLAAMGYRCSLFRKDKVGYPALPECDKKYGKTYNGKKKP